MTDPLRRRRSIWHIIRWVAVLPVAIAIYIPPYKALASFVNSYYVPASGEVLLATITAISTLAAVSAGALTAPGRRFQTACVLAVLFAGIPIGIVSLGVLLAGSTFDVLQLVPIEIAAGLIAVFPFWRGGKGKV